MIKFKRNLINEGIGSIYNNLKQMKRDSEK